ncbi:YdcF family protein [Pedobacter sp.]|uniref:YdcF family protein n=1 Tax=Pedobacter sp. TaxID=1411316 RepID=UPI003BAD78AB
MIFVLSKILLFLIKPIVWIIALLITALSIKTENTRKKLLASALVLLFLFSNGFIFGKIALWYEPRYPTENQYDVGILLGGFSAHNKRNNSIQFEDSGDRLFQTIKLYKTGKIGKILISSGNANLIDKSVKEADLAVTYLKQIGIPDTAILVENQSRNTLENAEYSLKLIEKYKSNASILIITSAWHIPRTKLIFSRFSKKQLDYYPTDFEGKTTFDLGDFIIPSASAFAGWEKILKEWAGLAVDGFR